MSEDTISRQAAIDAILAVTGNSSVRELYEHVQEHGLSDMWSGGVNAAIDIIIAVPSAQPEERTETHGVCLDAIDRQATIDALEKVAELFPWRVPGNRDSYDYYNEGWNDAIGRAEIEIEKLPSAQPETHEKRTETHACDCISRQAAIDIERNATVDTNPSHFVAHQKFTQFLDDAEISSFGRWQWSNGFNTALTAVGIDLKKLPSAQPEHTNSCYTNSWCIDCKEYDTENKCCPRYNRVIKQTLDDAYRHGETEAEARFHAQQRWIPCSERLPEEEGWYITTIENEKTGRRRIENDLFAIGIAEAHGNTPYKFCKDGYRQKTIAWMPFPEPYAERRTDE